MIETYDVLYFILILLSTIAIDRSNFVMLIISIVFGFFTFVIYPSYINSCNEDDDE